VDAEYQRAIEKDAPLFIFSSEYVKFTDLDPLVKNLYWPGS
jgi:hypothetical protein